jgi:hypothetical protein
VFRNIEWQAMRPWTAPALPRLTLLTERRLLRSPFKILGGGAWRTPSSWWQFLQRERHLMQNGRQLAQMHKTQLEELLMLVQ